MNAYTEATVRPNNSTLRTYKATTGITYLFITVKPLIFACPLFCEQNKTFKLKCANIDHIPTLIGIVCCLKIVWFEFAKIKDAKVNLHTKS